LRDQQKKAELIMERLTSEKNKLDSQLADNQLYEEQFKEKLKDLLSQQAKVQKQLEQAESDWMEASEQLDILEQAED